VDKVQGSIVHKLRRERWPNVSEKMWYIVDAVLGHSNESINVTTDGYATGIEQFIGSASDLVRNLQEMRDEADFTPEETQAFNLLVKLRIYDHRYNRGLTI